MKTFVFVIILVTAFSLFALRSFLSVKA